MSKYFGKIGYVITNETEPGIWSEDIVEKEYYGDIVKDIRRIENTNRIIDNVNISNRLSIVSDPFANENFHAMRYATYMGIKWRITEVEVAYPRLLLTLGGVYNA